jgi:hypothetical protein
MMLIKESMNKELITRKEGCPACGHKRARKTERAQIFTCAACNSISGTCYLGESYEMVLPYFTKDPAADSRARYFDFITLGSNGIDRRHGWFDPDTRLITQAG